MRGDESQPEQNSKAYICTYSVSLTRHDYRATSGLFHTQKADAVTFRSRKKEKEKKEVSIYNAHRVYLSVVGSNTWRQIKRLGKEYTSTSFSIHVEKVGGGRGWRGTFEINWARADRRLM